MRKMIALTMVLAVLAAGVGPALAETTLEKIARTETLTIGTRTGSPPFAYVNSKNEWVGFTIDLVEQLVLPSMFLMPLIGLPFLTRNCAPVTKKVIEKSTLSRRAPGGCARGPAWRRRGRSAPRRGWRRARATPSSPGRR